MTQALFYSSNAVAMTLAAGINSGDTTCSLSVATGLPASFPFKLLIGWGTGQQEVVHCTALSGTNATISRGQDGTTAQSHSIGASVVHGVSAREFNDLEAHVAASSGVHGLAGSVVGTTDAQNISNKTIDAASTLGGVSGTTLATERSAWATYAPQWSGTTSAPLSTNVGHYRQYGKLVVAQATLIASGPATAGVLLSNAPVAIGSGPPLQSPLGTFAWFVASTGVIRTGVVWYFSGSTLIQFRLDNATSYLTASIASGDSLSFNLSYESA